METLIINALIQWALDGHAYEFGKALVLMFIAYLAVRRLSEKSSEKIDRRLGGIEAAIEKTNKSLVTLEFNHAKEINALGKRVSVLEKKP